MDGGPVRVYYCVWHLNIGIKSLGVRWFEVAQLEWDLESLMTAPLPCTLCNVPKAVSELFYSVVWHMVMQE